MENAVNKSKPAPALPESFARPVALVWVFVLPQVVLMLINIHACWLVGPESKPAWIAVLACQAVLIALAAAMWGVNRSAGKPVPAAWSLALMLGPILYLFVYMNLADKLVPWGMDRWIIDGGDVMLSQFTFLMPGIFYGLMRLSCHKVEVDQEKLPALLVGGILLLPSLLMGTVALFGNLYGVWSLVPFIIFTVVALFFTHLFIRFVMVTYQNLVDRGTLDNSIFRILLAVSGPALISLLAKVFDVWTGPEQIFMLLLVSANGILMIVPSLRQPGWQGVGLFLRSVTYPVTCYFFLIVLPYLPLGVLATIFLGFGFLVWIPVALFLLHTRALVDDGRAAVESLGRSKAIAFGCAGILVLPLYFGVQAVKDKIVLKQALDYVYSSEARGDLTFTGSAQDVARTMQALKQFKEGSGFPYLSGIYNAIVFDGMVLSDQKINYVYKLFSGEDIKPVFNNDFWGTRGRRSVRNSGWGWSTQNDRNVTLVSEEVSSFHPSPGLTQSTLRLAMAWPPQDEGTLTQRQVEDFGLDWNDVSGKLIQNGWAAQKGPGEVRLTIAYPESAKGRMSAVFGEKFQKVFFLVQQAHGDKSTADQWRTSGGPREFYQTIDLPPGVLISGFRLKVGQENVPGRIFEKKTALWVYDQITTTRRDPGILTYLSPTRVELKVFPIQSNETRQVEIDLLYPENFSGTVKLGDRSVALAAAPADAPPAGTLGVYSVVLSEGVIRQLPGLLRKPYLHFIIDRSSLSAKDAYAYEALIRAVADKSPQITKAKLTAANFETQLLTPEAIDVRNDAQLGSVLRKASLPRRGALDLQRVLQNAILEYKEKCLDRAESGCWQEYPLFVVLTSSPRNVLPFPEKLDPLMRYVPETSEYYIVSLNQDKEPRPLWSASELAVSPKVVVLRQGSRVSVVSSRARGYVDHIEAGRLEVFDPDAGAFKPVENMKFLGDNPAYEQGLELMRRNEAALMSLRLMDQDKKWLVDQSRELGILIPATAYMVVERDAQWRGLEDKEQDMMRASDAFDFDPVPTGNNVDSPAPSWLIMLLAVVFWYGFKRWRLAKERVVWLRKGMGPLLFLVFFFSITSISQAGADPDWVIEPGRLGPITADTTEEDLIRVYGAANVITEHQFNGDSHSDATYVFPNDRTKKLIIDWFNRNPCRNPRSVQVIGNKWATRDGIRLGTKLKEIVQLNGQPVELRHNKQSFWDSEYEWWSISDVKEGRLKELAGQQIYLDLQPGTQGFLQGLAGSPKEEFKEKEKVLSDDTFVKEANFFVQEITMFFKSPE